MHKQCKTFYTKFLSLKKEKKTKNSPPVLRLKGVALYAGGDRDVPISAAAIHSGDTIFVMGRNICRQSRFYRMTPGFCLLVNFCWLHILKPRGKKKLNTKKLQAL